MKDKNIRRNANALPGFFSNGLIVETVDGKQICNVPGYSHIINEQLDGYVLSKLLITHYHPLASHNANIVNALYQECIAELLEHGGTIPHSSIQDWLHFKGYKGEAIA